jgi:hypothetical protein
MSAADYRKKQLQDEIETLKERLVALDRFGSDDWPVGTVLTFDKRYGGSAYSTKYRFAAIKTGVTAWYVTGNRHGVMTWDSLTSLILEREKDVPVIWWASEWTEME